MSLIPPPSNFTPVQDRAGLIAPIWQGFFTAIHTAFSTVPLVTGGVLYYDGTKVTTSADFTFDATTGLVLGKDLTVSGFTALEDVSAGNFEATSFLCDGNTQILGGLSVGQNGLGFFFTIDGATGATVLASSLTVDTTTLVVDATNHRVGIGTVSPSVLLDVEGGDLLVRHDGNAARQSKFQNADTTSSSSRQDIQCIAGNVTLAMSCNHGLQANFGTTTNHPLVFFTNNTDVARFSTAGVLRLIGSSQRTIEATDGTYRQLKYDAASHVWHESGALSMTLSGGTLDCGTFSSGGTSGFSNGGLTPYTNFHLKGGLVVNAT